MSGIDWGKIGGLIFCGILIAIYVVIGIDLFTSEWPK